MRNSRLRLQRERQRCSQVENIARMVRCIAKGARVRLCNSERMGANTSVAMNLDDRDKIRTWTAVKSRYLLRWSVSRLLSEG